MRKNKTSIEYSHIYTNESFSHEHEQSVVVLKDVLGTLEEQNYTKIVLIDNYNSTEHLLDTAEFIKKLEELDGEPDFYAYEADMSEYSDKMLAAIEDPKVFKSYNRYINGKNHMPCSFMTAIWYLLRLGEFEARDGLIRKVGEENFGPSDSIINILPERFRGVEAKTMALLSASKFSESTQRIKTVFFE